jgi:hypothetical protein
VSFRAAAVVSILLAAACVEREVPDGWRLPDPRETYATDNRAGPWRDESRNKFLVARGDFDGDGAPDVARLLVSVDGRQMALFVFLGSGPWLQLDAMKSEQLEVMGIDALPPGAHRTVCGKGYRNCEPGEPEILELRFPGIDYFKAESASSVFYWSPADKRFLRLWLSD